MYNGKRGKVPLDPRRRDFAGLFRSPPPSADTPRRPPSLVLLVMKSGDQIKHKLSYLSRRLTPTTRKRGRRDAAKGFRVFLGCHIIVTVHALLLQMSGYPPPSGVPAVHPPRPSSRFIPRSLSSNETDTLRLMTNIASCQERQSEYISIREPRRRSRRSISARRKTLSRKYLF